MSSQLDVLLVVNYRPGMKELGIEVSIHDELPRLEIVYEHFLRQMRRASPVPFILLPAGIPRVDQQFPAIAKWVQGHGHIEIGEQEGVGFVVRALDSGGVMD